MVKQNVILTFNAVKGNYVHFEVSNSSGKIVVTYNPKDSQFVFENNSQLAEILKRNQFQLAKVVNSSLKSKPVPGKEIPCLFIENFPFLNSSDYDHFIRVDMRTSQPLISVSHEELGGIHKIYTDGSYASENNQSGYAFMIVNPLGETVVFNDSYSGGSSNLVELQAVLLGIKQLSTYKKIQVNTDSRFVIRGLSQWIHFWRFNDWKMAYGRKISYAEQWQELDHLIKGKFLELKWIKSHSGDRNQEFCHRLAKQMATKNSQKLISD